MLFCASCAFAQKKEFRYEKDLGWAKWVFTSIEFNDDYTIVRGHFIPGENGCWVSTDKTETLQANGKEYRLLETTLPKDIILVKKTFQSGNTVTFVEKFEPIMNLDGLVSYKSKNFLFDIANACIDIKPDLQRKYSTYAERILEWKENALGEKEYLRYLSHCAEELSLMPKDSAALARSYLGNCYNVYEIFMNSYPGSILNNWNIIRKMHHGLTGKKLKKSEQRYLNSVAEFANEVSWKSKILTTDNLNAIRRKAGKVFRESDKEQNLYKHTMLLLGDSTYRNIAIPDLRLGTSTYQQALDRYNVGDYVGAYGIFPYSIHFKYKVLPREDFIEYCNTLHENHIATLAHNINIPQTITLSYGSMYSDVLSITEITPLLETMPYFARETNDPEFICHALDGILNAKAFKYYADRYMKETLGGIHETSETSETNKSYALSSKIWDAMKDELADAESVYFSPSGILHSLPLESCDTTRLYYRLTSTKELLKRQKSLPPLNPLEPQSPILTCVLYGGLEYGDNMPPMLSQRQMREFTARGPLDDISEQSGAEVDTIASLLQEKGVEAIVFKQRYGTEESFKALDNTNVDAIHISTHGFYWESDKVASDENAAYSFLKLEESKLPDEEKAMVRSALLLADAQEAMEGGKGDSHHHRSRERS